jgi:hypothetical protein
MGLATGKCASKQRRKKDCQGFDSKIKEWYIFGQRSVAEDVRKVKQKEMQKGNVI